MERRAFGGQHLHLYRPCPCPLHQIILTAKATKHIYSITRLHTCYYTETQIIGGKLAPFPAFIANYCRFTSFKPFLRCNKNSFAASIGRWMKMAWLFSHKAFTCPQTLLTATTQIHEKILYHQKSYRAHPYFGMGDYFPAAVYLYG